MKKKLSFIIIFMMSLQIFAQDFPAYKIFDSEGNETTYSVMITQLSSADMVFFGELHNNTIAHWLELNVTKSLFELKNDKLILGAEMFEADGQVIFDEYFNDIISEKSFEEEMRLWPNYETDYKPIVVFAKENNLKFIATNIPRRYASVVFKKDFVGLENVSDEGKSFIAPLPINWDSEVDCYKQMIAGMKGMGGPGGETIAKAQAMKDATMAYFMLKNWKKGQLFLHFNGSFHSDNHEGICWHISQKNSSIKMMTITTVSQDDISILDARNINSADFIICVPEDMTTTY